MKRPCRLDVSERSLQGTAWLARVQAILQEETGDRMNRRVVTSFVKTCEDLHPLSIPSGQHPCLLGDRRRNRRRNNSFHRSETRGADFKAGSAFYAFVLVD